MVGEGLVLTDEEHADRYRDDEAGDQHQPVAEDLDQFAGRDGQHGEAPRGRSNQLLMARKTSSSRVGPAARSRSSTAWSCAQPSRRCRSFCSSKVSTSDLPVRVDGGPHRQRRRRCREGEADDRGQGAGQLGDGAFPVEGALVHQPDPVRALLRLLQVVRGEHDGRAVLPEPVHRRPDGIAGLDVEAGGRLVQEDQLRGAVDGGGEVQPPLLPAGQLRHLAAGLGR